MKKISRILVLSSCIVLILTYFLPIWSISLDAPQYPEGIGMYVWLYTIDGHHPHDLDNINGLNHYIGMKKIVPESIPELKLMPYIMGFMILLALVAFLINKKWMVWIWVILFILIMIVGLYDYYIWGYDYGHDLNPKAAIKVPGMSYQPPLIGSKKLLNFTSTSWPAAGGFVIGISILMGMTAIFLDSRKGN
jgi:copper chaperone NosL